jgi:hypothetical protein
MSQSEWSPVKPAYARGETRQMDVLAMTYGDAIGLVTLTGAQIRASDSASAALAKDTARVDKSLLRILPLDRVKLQADRAYLVACSPWDMSRYIADTQTAPDTYRLTNHTFREAWERYFAAK